MFTLDESKEAVSGLARKHGLRVLQEWRTIDGEDKIWALSCSNAKGRLVTFYVEPEPAGGFSVEAQETIRLDSCLAGNRTIFMTTNENFAVLKTKFG